MSRGRIIFMEVGTFPFNYDENNVLVIFFYAGVFIHKYRGV